MDPLLVITDAGASSTDQESLSAALHLLRAETSVEVQAARDPGELDSVLHRAASRRIVVAGGDGSWHTVVRALHRRHDLARSVLGLIPLGIGNDFALVNDIPLDPVAAARVLLAGVVRPRDLLVDEVGEIVANAVHAASGEDGPRSRWATPPVLHLRIEVDGIRVVDLDRPVLMVAVGNGSLREDDAELAPGAVAGDGLLDVLVSHPVPTTARLAYAGRRLLGKTPDDPGHDEVIHVRGRSVSVSGESFWVSADGEVYGPERHRSWHIEPAAYSMLLPA